MLFTVVYWRRLALWSRNLPVRSSFLTTSSVMVPRMYDPSAMLNSRKSEARVVALMVCARRRGTTSG